jgi:hypothetical protein
VTRTAHPKLDSTFASLVATGRARGLAAAHAEAVRAGVMPDGDLVRVTLHLDGHASVDLRQAVERLGGVWEASAGRRANVRVPIDSLEAVGNLAAVKAVRAPLEATPHIVSAGVEIIGAGRQIRAGNAGAGMKIAVLDLGFAGYESLLGTELPRTVVTRAFGGDISGGGEKHGTAVAEIVHDVAPGAALYLVSFRDEVQFQQAVDYLISESVDVINASFGFACAGPLDGTGAVSAAASRAATAGILWVSAAGNLAQRHWSGTFTDANANSWHDFTALDEGNSLRLEAGQKVRVCLQWDDWVAPSHDFDLVLVDTVSNTVVKDAVSRTASDPTEFLEFTPSADGEYHVMIQRRAGTTAVRLDLYVTPGPGDPTCAAEAALFGEPDAQLLADDLRAFRDTALSADALGSALRKAFYAHAPELKALMWSHAGLATDILGLVRDVHPFVLALTSLSAGDRGPADALVIEAALVERGQVLIEALRAMASPALRADLEWFERQIPVEQASGQTLAAFWAGLNRGTAGAPSAFSDLEYAVAGGSVTAPADSRDAVAVGAIAAGTDTIESFSSQGPTSDGRRKPDISAPDAVCTASLGNCDERGFLGTSAAAPHVAGAAALLWTLNPTLSLPALRDLLLASSVDLGAAGPDPVFGVGRVLLPAPVCLGTAPQITVHPLHTEVERDRFDQPIPTTLVVTAAGTGPLTYQWYEGFTGDDSRPISGATGASLAIGTAARRSGRYWVRVSNACGSADSADALVWLSLTWRYTRFPNPPVFPTREQLRLVTGANDLCRATDSGYGLTAALPPVNTRWPANASSRPTVVVTHGWAGPNEKSSVVPKMPCELVAALLDAGVTARANVAWWEWVPESIDPGGPWPTHAAARAEHTQGDALAGRLAVRLGLTTSSSSFSQTIHFVGFSLGSVVNRVAAETLISRYKVDPSRIHVTILDAPTGIRSTPLWLEPVPNAAVGWLDNYYSEFGSTYPDATNVDLHPNTPIGWSAGHGYAWQWYACSVYEEAGLRALHGDCGTVEPASNLVGFQWAAEASGGSLESAPKLPMHSRYIQTDSWSDSLLDVSLQRTPAPIRTTTTMFARATPLVPVLFLAGPTSTVGPVNNDLQIRLGTTSAPAVETGVGGDARASAAATGTPTASTGFRVTVPAGAQILSLRVTRVACDGLVPTLSIGVNQVEVLSRSMHSVPCGSSTSVALSVAEYVGQEIEVFVGVAGTAAATMITVDRLAFLTLTDTPMDKDADGLADDWEVTFGLSARSSSGDDGPQGDPDGDGVSNADEERAGTHPRGLFRRYLAEGATGSLFNTTLAVVNPSSTETAKALVSFLDARGTERSEWLEVAPLSRTTIDVRQVTGMASQEFSTVIESDVPIVVDRTMSWDRTGYGAHTETALAGPSTTWYLAEGATHSGLNLFYLIQNPSADGVAVTVRYLRPAPAPPVVRTYPVGGRSRFNIWVNLEPGLQSTDVSAVITATQPIIVERAMYLSSQGRVFSAGHESAAIAAPATEWFLAEGATGPYFDLFVLIANPGTQDAEVEATYLLPDGTTIVKPYHVPATSRFNIWVDNEGGRLADTAVSTTVRSTNAVPIIVERAMWWPGDYTTWHEAHNSPGATATGVLWATADGEVGGERGIETYLLVANTSATAARVKVTLLLAAGTTLVREFDVSAKSRFNVSVADEFPSLAGKRFGALVESVGSTPAQIVVERAMYWDAAGQHWAAGTNALATRLQ